MHEMYDLSQPVRLRAVFTNTAGALADPTTITLTVTDPSGAITTYTRAAGQLTAESTGIWYRDVTPATAGVWTYEYVAAGNGVDDTQSEYFVVGKAVDDGPCDPWTTPDAIFSVPPLDGIAAASRDYTLAAEAVDASSRILFRLTKSRYPGICYSTVRPCHRAPRWGPAYAQPGGWNTTWGDCGCGAGNLRACGCSGLTEVLLAGEYPILGIQRVRVDGTTLASTTYRVDDDRYLARIDGESWPSCQDLTADPAADANTWDVTFWYGRPAPAEGVIAAKMLAAQLYAGQVGLDCALPATMRSRTLQGVEEELISISDLEDGKFGIREVDWFLNAEIQAERRRPAIVASPDFLPQVRRTGT